MQTTLRGLPGVAEVTIDFEKKLASCVVDQEKFDATTAVNELASVGFKDSKIKTN